MFRRILAVAAAVLFVASAQAQDCRLKRLAALDLIPATGGRLTVEVKVNDQPFHLMVDTGSDHTMLNERAANALGLKLQPFPNSASYLWGGTQLKYLATADTLQIGRMVLGHSTFYVLPEGRMAPGEDGILGTDILARFDADFDFAKGKLNLVEHNSCAGSAVYWTDEAQATHIPFRKQTRDIPITSVAINKLVVTVTVDGKEELAILDTGAFITSLDLETAQSDLGLKDDSPGMVKLKRPEGSFGYTFKTLSFGGVTVANPKVRLDPYAVHQMGKGGPKMLVGMDVLSKLHLYIAYQERMLYVSGATAGKAAP